MDIGRNREAMTFVAGTNPAANYSPMARPPGTAKTFSPRPIFTSHNNRNCSWKYVYPSGGQIFDEIGDSASEYSACSGEAQGS